MSSLPPLASQDRAFGAVLVVLFGILQALALGVAAFATRDAFAALHAGHAMPLAVQLSLGAAGGLAALCVFLARLYSEAIGQSYANALRKTLYAHIAGLPLDVHQRRRQGAFALRFVGDLTAARNWFGRGLLRVITAAAVLPGAAATLFLLDQRLAIHAVIPVATALLCATVVAIGLTLGHRRLRSKRASISISMFERLSVSPELDLAGRTPRELKALDEQGRTLRRNAIARRARSAGVQMILAVGLALAGVAVLSAAARLGTTPGTVAAALSVLAILALPLQELALAWDAFCAWRIAREKALNLFSQPSRNRRTEPKLGPAALGLCGQFQGQAIDVAVGAGDMLCINGPTGTGKSRIAAAIAGLDAIPGLAITHDGQADRQPTTTYIGDMHVALQGSLRRSLTLSCGKRPPDDRILIEAERFGLCPTIDRLGGLDSRISEAGRSLSSGESLRMDCVRAVLSAPGLIVIDSDRFRADPDAAEMLRLLRTHTEATFAIVGWHNTQLDVEDLCVESRLELSE